MIKKRYDLKKRRNIIPPDDLTGRFKAGIFIEKAGICSEKNRYLRRKKRASAQRKNRHLRRKKTGICAEEKQAFAQKKTGICAEKKQESVQRKRKGQEFSGPERRAESFLSFFFVLIENLYRAAKMKYRINGKDSSSGRLMRQSAVENICLPGPDHQNVRMRI